MGVFVQIVFIFTSDFFDENQRKRKEKELICRSGTRIYNFIFQLTRFIRSMPSIHLEFIKKHKKQNIDVGNTVDEMTEVNRYEYDTWLAQLVNNFQVYNQHLVMRNKTKNHTKMRTEQPCVLLLLYLRNLIFAS